MKATVFSYRFAEEILQHPSHENAWKEIQSVIVEAPLFIFPGKSKKNKKLDVVQQLLNTYFDRRLAIDLKWEFHPLATQIKNSGLRADYRKKFGDLTVQAEIQFGNMSRWYSDVFKFQTAYAQSLVNLGLSIVPTSAIASRIDSNVANFERTKRELPSADLSITLPILLVGVDADKDTKVVDVSETQFKDIKEITGKSMLDNRWRVVNGYLSGVAMKDIGPKSKTGPTLEIPEEELEEEETGTE